MAAIAWQTDTQVGGCLNDGILDHTSAIPALSIR